MSITDNFVKKFYQLWNAGHTAHLDVDTHAGNAWVGLRVQLGCAPGPLHHHPHPPFFQAQKKTVSPSRQRRRARRAAARMTNAEEAVNVETPKDTTIETEAEEVEFPSSIATAVEAVEADAVAGSLIVTEHSSDITEKVLDDEVDNSFIGTIPQLDGGLEAKSNDPNYCKICKDSDELESAEDLSYHMMNDHDPQEVLALFGHNWIEERRYCIRKGSPFEKCFFTPII